MHNYRKAKVGDGEQLALLMAQLGYQLSAETLEKRLQELENSESTVWVVENDSAILVGCLQLLIDHRLAEGKCLEIVSLVVDQNVRGEGLGTQLIEQAKQQAIRDGFDELKVRANAIREQAHQFYKGLGFREIKQQKVFKCEL